MTTDQIAAQFAKSALETKNPRFKLYRNQDPTFRQDDIDFWTAVIKAAIEKAHQEGWYEGRNHEAKFGVKADS